MQLPSEAKSRAERAREQIAAMQADAGIAPRSEEMDTDAAAPAVVEDAEKDVAAESAAAEPAAPATPVAPAPADEKPEGGAKRRERIDPEDWEQRFKLLRASRDETAATLRAELGQANTRIKELEREREREAPTPEAPKRVDLGEAAKKVFDESEAEVIAQVAAHSDKRIDELEAKAQAREARLRDRMWEELDTISPGWRALDRDTAFNAWLDGRDEATGVNRREALGSFLDDFDAQSVAKLVHAYEASSESGDAGQQATTPAAAPSPTPESQRSAPGADDLEQMIEIWSPAEVKAHYAEKHELIRLKKFKGAVREEIEQREQAIELALREGRVR